MTNEQIKMRDELLKPYADAIVKNGSDPRTTGLEVLLRCAANEVVMARSSYKKTEWRNELPLETATMLGNFIRAVRLGKEKEFSARLEDIEGWEERRDFISMTNAKNVFIEDYAMMKTTDEVLYEINSILS